MVTILGSVLQNALLTVPVAIGGSSIDPINGNPVPTVRNYTVSAYLKFVAKPPKQIAATQPADTPYLWVEGYIASVVDPLLPNVPLPSALPDRVATEGVAATIGDRSGIFYPIDRIYDTALNPYLDREILGEKIWGWFDVAI